MLLNLFNAIFNLHSLVYFENLGHNIEPLAGCIGKAGRTLNMVTNFLKSKNQCEDLNLT